MGTKVAHAHIRKVAENVKRLRFLAKLTQQDLSAKAGVSQRAVSYIERAGNDADRDNVTFGTLANIARGLDVPLPVLLAEDSDTEELFRAWYRFSDAERHWLIRSVRMLHTSGTPVG